MRTHMNCKNCENPVVGNFCAHCGQRTSVGRQTFRSFMNELSESVFQLNRGLLYTVKELTVRPGYTIRQYLEGKRKSHYRPLAFVLLLSTIYFLLSRAVGADTILDNFLFGFSNASEASEYGESITPVLQWFSKNFAYSSLLLLPVFSLATYISFSGLGKNYLEHIIINSFITGQQAIIYTVFMLISVFTDQEYDTTLPAVLAVVSYVFWTFSQLYVGLGYLRLALGVLLTYVLYLLFISALLLAL